MFLLKQIAPAVLVALIVAAGVSALARLWKGPRANSAVVACALGLAYFCGHLVNTGWFALPPADTTNWLPFFALAAAVLGAVDSAVAVQTWVRLLAFVLFSAGVFWLLLRPKFQYGWSPAQGIVWVLCLAAAMVLLAFVIDALSKRPSSTAVATLLFLLIACGGTFGALMLSGSLLLGQFAAVLMAALFGILVLNFQRASLGRAIVPVFATLLAALLASGYFFSELPGSSALLLAASPALALVPVRRLMPVWTFLAQAALMSVPIFIALALAFHASPPLEY
jgi:hypothetical protein